MKSAWHRHYLVRRYLYGPALRVVSKLLFIARPLVPVSWAALDRPVFVIGMSRSGTTAFSDEFGAHPDVCQWSEAAQILDLSFYDPQNDTSKGPEDVTPEDAWRIRLLFGLRTRVARRSRFTNKHPENSLRIGYLTAIFPDALFIHVIRDGRAVVESNYRTVLGEPVRIDWPFGQFPKPVGWRDYLDLPLVEQYAHQWVDVVGYIRRSAREAGLADDRYREIRYEELCAAPVELLESVDEFCGLDPDRRSTRGSFDSRNAQWESGLSPRDRETVQAIIGDLNSRLGY